ncbi:restriction endonuclease subunit S [Epilithonimonas sp.]|uniref:restriction endonuclease subunit S n=1 Tax=Epilithonimonas sp. TaxID=2894511 RepID=UPI00289D4EEE|nr:restriction endonuclease subunit S [Epilithonimonas sp.]
MVKENTMKQTEIGLLPEDWNVINLEENFTLKARIGWQGLTTAEYLENGEYGLVTGTDFRNGYIDWDNCVFVEKIRFDQDKNIQLKKGDVLVTKDGTIGKIAFIDYLPKPTTLNSGVFVVRPKSTNINSRFFYYVLMSFYFDDFLLKITAGSTITHLYQKDFVNFNLICPPLPEQEAIAEALSDADSWIESLEQLIAKKYLIKQGVMQELLTPKEDWEVKKLGDLTKIFTKQTGFDYSAYIKPSLVRAKTDETIPFIQNKDFKNKWINLNTDYFIPKSIALKFPKILLDEKSLLVSISGSVGNVGVYELPDLAFIGGAVAILKFKNPLLIDWVSVYLQSDAGQSKLLNNVKSGSHQNLILDDIRKIEILFPEFSEQTRIATILSDMDAELEALEAQLGKARKVKLGMMQELLTGRVRLV